MIPLPGITGPTLRALARITKLPKHQKLGSAGENRGKLKPVAPFVWQTGITKKRSRPADQRAVVHVAPVRT
jgi:hypothetical protein